MCGPCECCVLSSIMPWSRGVLANLCVCVYVCVCVLCVCMLCVCVCVCVVRCDIYPLHLKRYVDRSQTDRERNVKFVIGCITSTYFLDTQQILNIFAWDEVLRCKCQNIFIARR